MQPPSSPIEFRQCLFPGCRFRYPVVAPVRGGHWCPRCGFKTKKITQQVAWEPEIPVKATGESLQIEAYLDNIRSAYNVGSIFRTADGVGVGRLHLGGISPTPENPKVAKTALGAQHTVAWQHHPNGIEAIQRLKAMGYQVWSLEHVPDADHLFNIHIQLNEQPLLLAFGNESAGIDPGILEISDKIVSLPMLGQKSSLNVVVAFGISVYYLRFGHWKGSVS